MNKLDTALIEVENLIAFLHSQLGIAGNMFLLFQRAELGSLRLDYEEAVRYNKCLRNLIEASVKDEDLSRRSVEAALQEAILKALNTDDLSRSIEVRSKAAIKDLKVSLHLIDALSLCGE